MKAILRVVGRFALVALPLAAGLALVVQGISTRTAPAERAVGEMATPARVLTVAPRNYTPTVVASGTVAPARTWRAIAQVPAEVEWMHPDLRGGRLIDAGTEILRLDATDFELGEAQAEAGLARVNARLAELETQQSNLEANLAIARRGLSLAETERERRDELRGRDAASQSVVDQAETSALERRARVQEIENALAMLPVQRRAQQAEKAIAEAQLAEARRNIARTRVEMPFDGRIAGLSVQLGQFVSAGQEMVLADGISRMEIPVPLAAEQLLSLLDEDLEISSVLDLSAAEIDALPRTLGLTAAVHLRVAGLDAVWPAQVDRLSFALDPQTRMAHMVVAVDEPFRGAEPAIRPPLVSGMYVDVRIAARARPGRIVLPREALAPNGDGQWLVHVLDADDRLRSRTVNVEGFVRNAAIVSAGLETGERVIAGALSYAIEGMKIAPQDDAELEARMTAYAAGSFP